MAIPRGHDPQGVDHRAPSRRAVLVAHAVPEALALALEVALRLELRDDEVPRGVDREGRAGERVVGRGEEARGVGGGSMGTTATMPCAERVSLSCAI